MSYRQFWITNGSGQTVYLTQETSKIFLNNPTGLGISNAISTNQYAEALNVVETEQNFATIGGEMLFYDVANQNRYDAYNDFVAFLQKTPLVFYYQIPLASPETYSMDVALASLDKTESKTNGLLSCSFSLIGLSRWKGAEVETTGTASSYTLQNDGHMPVGMEVTIEGTGMENPYFTLTQDSELYGEAKFIDATAFNSVYVNSKDGEQEVIVEQGGSVMPNPLSFQDLSISNGAIYVTFVKLATGTSTLAIGMDSGSITGVTIKFTPMYRSV